ncbi:MAG: archaellum operon transcriptional activator EarA family protein [Methanosarcinales archaeon]|nr:putative transcriptional regulator [ANME-2 cluster archaeon]MDW7776396.1 archaellum operon transcriptional activator EarA family protein [Methanosarcinales archaeon]
MDSEIRIFKDIHHPQIVRSLKKSRVRTEIMMYLYKIYPNSSYPSDISRHTKIDSTNVIGGLRGMGHRYDKANSLIGVELVESINFDGTAYYRLSDTGKRWIETMDLMKKDDVL